ncbi:putative protease [uncultured Caudovirales phage]|uniref:Putative protease n=1 Tax=uncultured Caudovirales phage TaxID=2100421 RepID=A0A6J5P728_9CAUD|nr:putative protease [uncultured Caudovirales phage]
MLLDGQTSPDSVADTTGASTSGATAAEAKAPEAAAAPDQAPNDEGTQQAAPAGAPEKYEAFTVPEGVTLDDAARTNLETFAKDLNLTQEQAQKLLDRDLAAAASSSEALQANFQSTVAQWVEAAKTDPVIGGAEFDKNLGVAKAGMDRFATDDMKALLRETNFGNHPTVIKHFHALGKLLEQDKFVQGQKAPTGAKTLAERLYGNNN